MNMSSENIILIVNPRNLTGWKRILDQIVWGILGVLAILVAIKESSGQRYFLGFIGLIFFHRVLRYDQVYPHKEYLFTEEGIEERINGKGNKYFRWIEIQYVEVKLRALNLLTKSGDKLSIYVGNNSMDVRTRIVDFIKSKNVNLLAA